MSEADKADSNGGWGPQQTKKRHSHVHPQASATPHVSQGMGAAIALPMLDAMTPALSAIGRSAAPSPLRMAFTYVPNGITMADWTPKGAGAAFELSRVMKPMAPFRQDMSILSGLAHRNGMALGDGPGDHARAAASY